MSRFYVGQKVGLLWENTPYFAEGMLEVFVEVGVIAKLPSHDDDDELYDIVGVNIHEPDKVYKFFDDEMIIFSSPTLQGDLL